MPAKNLLRVPDKDVYLHIYNKGVEGKIIFADEQDSTVFLGYLRDYLIDPQLVETQKKSFTVKGKTYQGTPHQPKNYYKKVELIAYSINPDHFHLVVHQKAHDVIQGFIRSLCTRYSIYFNKKYERRGSLFEGPYKSAQIPDTNMLLHLVTYLHKNHGSSAFSSLNIYLNKESCAWMSKFDFSLDAENEISMQGTTYNGYAENYQYTDKEKQLLTGLIIEKEPTLLERRILDKDLSSISKKTTDIEHKKEQPRDNKTRRIPEYIGLTITFLLLLTLGLRNVSITTLQAEASNNENQNKIQTPVAVNTINNTKYEPQEVLSASDSAATTDPLSLIYSYTVIKKGSGTILIYKEKDVNSGAITTAHDGDHFVAFPIDNDWYQIRFTDDSKGYILSKYVDIEQINSK